MPKIISSEEAKKKMCPFISEIARGKTCITCSCMMWENDTVSEENGYCGLLPGPAVYED